jgi:hypothetical protein
MLNKHAQWVAVYLNKGRDTPRRAKARNLGLIYFLVLRSSSRACFTTWAMIAPGPCS